MYCMTVPIYMWEMWPESPIDKRWKQIFIEKLDNNEQPIIESIVKSKICVRWTSLESEVWSEWRLSQDWNLHRFVRIGRLVVAGVVVVLFFLLFVVVSLLTRFAWNEIIGDETKRVILVFETRRKKVASNLDLFFRINSSTIFNGWWTNCRTLKSKDSSLGPF